MKTLFSKENFKKFKKTLIKNGFKEKPIEFEGEEPIDEYHLDITGEDNIKLCTLVISTLELESEFEEFINIDAELFLSDGINEIQKELNLDKVNSIDSLINKINDFAILFD